MSFSESDALTPDVTVQGPNISNLTKPIPNLKLNTKEIFDDFMKGKKAPENPLPTVATVQPQIGPNEVIRIRL